MQKVMVQLILMFAKQGNMNALRKLAGQVKLPVREIVNKARSSIRYFARNDAIESARKLGTPMPKGAIKQKLQEIKESPNALSNINKIIKDNVRRYNE